MSNRKEEIEFLGLNFIFQNLKINEASKIFQRSYQLAMRFDIFRIKT